MTYFGQPLFEWRSGPLFVSERAYGARARIAAHVHEQPYVCVVTRGEYTEVTPRAAHDCRRATVLLHPAGSRHSDRFAAVDSRCLVVEIDPRWLAEHDAPRALREHAVFRHGPVSTLGMRIESEMRTRDDVTRLALEGLLLETIAAAERCTRDDVAMPAWLRRAIEQLHDDPRALSDVAAAAGVHPGHFARAFRRHAGCTVGEYVRRVRVERAKERIASGDALADVAIACGFADQSHFTRTFRRIAGVTPAAYRRAV